MDSNELKFSLKLLGCENYRTSLTGKTFNGFKNKNKICQKLSDRELVDYSSEISAVKILPPGRALLKLDSSQLPISANEVKVLEKIAKSSTKLKPSEIKIVKVEERDTILQNFADRGLIETDTQIKSKKAEVWLTQRGIEYLRDEFTAKGTSPVISLDLLNNYLRFLRKSLRGETRMHSNQDLSTIGTDQPSDEQILQIIQNLDKELGTENYLPIFHLRQKLQPPLSKEELDQALYRLQRNDQIELRTLMHAEDYSEEQVSAGINQRSGNPLFFIKVTVS